MQQHAHSQWMGFQSVFMSIPRFVLRTAPDISECHQVLDQIVQLVLGHVISNAVLVLRIVSGPDFLERFRNPVVEVGRRVIDIVQMGHIETRLRVRRHLGADVVNVAVGVQRRKVARGPGLLQPGQAGPRVRGEDPGRLQEEIPGPEVAVNARLGQAKSKTPPAADYSHDRASFLQRSVADRESR